MSELLPEDTWVNNFLPTPPRPLLSSLQRRLHTSTTHLNALSEVYKQRAQIEATYAESLSKLAKTAEQGGLSGKTGNEWDKASGEGRLWDSVISELSETSASHSTLSAMIRTDFEQPLRDLPSKVIAWRRISEQDASLDKTLKDYEKVAGKLEKAQQKSKSSKADQLHQELNQLTSQLSSLSPMVYTTYQRLDEERLRTLKEVIVRWGTVKGDMATRDGQRAEGIIANLLSWETGEEVLSVGRKLGNIGGNGAAAAPRPSVPNSTVSTPQSNRRMSTVTASSQAHDFSPRPTPRQNGSTTSFGKEQSSGGGLTGGLKSMLGRKKTLAVNRTRSGSNATSTRSGRDENARDGGFDLLSDDVPRIQGSSSSAPPVDEEGFSVAPADRHRNLWEEPNEQVSTPVATPHNQTHFGTTFTSSPAASQENLSSSASSQHQTQPRLNLSLAAAPIQESEEERQAALQKMQQTLQMPPSQPSRRNTVARGRRDVRNTMFVGGLTEEQSLGLGALSLGKVSEPEEQLSASPISATSPTQTTNGDRPGQVARQVSMSSVTSNNPFDSPSLSGSAMAQPNLPVPSTEAGLRANLNETINVIIKNKEVSRIQINGEIHLSLRPSYQQPTTGPIHIRLTSFERLEKIAPNPAYLAQVPDKPGEYFLNSEVLTSATANSKNPNNDKGTLLFKYVVHVQPGKEGSNAPLILDPAFLCKEGETRMILHYRLNDLSPIQQLSNVSFSALFAPGPSVSNVQAKPAGGVWSPSQRRMTWKLDNITSNQESKIIAKFVTEPGNGESLSPQNVQVTFNSEGSLVSGLGVEIVDGELEGHDTWKFEEVKKGVLSGKYLAEAHVNVNQ
ncbi:hypothetical protein I203_106146 [Kwoniella mangroviensis CBS 8507]|uniref:uncharacterized protein n=1 Tax=Kwoniella mangroviensis CBS 8507 TaxID=1296122 RepID=UPI00080D4AA4|nr:uncharacterized protein I203_04622 [Kwoniella mangroviensis CBS 8507]OCF66291.1 hypothetical protein I203_04622 [Kwoniella mangroviensis CBS 8507]